MANQKSDGRQEEEMTEDEKKDFQEFEDRWDEKFRVVGPEWNAKFYAKEFWLASRKSLREENKSLKSQIDINFQCLRFSGEERREVEGLTKKLMEENEKLRGELKDFRIIRDTLIDTREEVIDLKDRLKVSHAAHVDTMKQLTDKISELEARIFIKDKHLEAFGIMLNKAHAEIARLRGEVPDAGCRNIKRKERD